MRGGGGRARAGAATRDDIRAAQRADQRRGYGTDYYSGNTGLSRTKDPDRPSDPRTDLGSRNLTPPNLTDAQKKALEERRKSQEGRDKTTTPSKPGEGAQPGANKVPVIPVNPNAGGAAPSGGRKSSKSIEMLTGGSPADPGYLRLVCFYSFPEDSTDTVKVTVNLNNAKGVGFDEVCFTLKYDPGFLAFVAPVSATRAALLGGDSYVDDEGAEYPHALVRSASDGYVNYVDRQAGVVRYMAHSVNRDPLKSQGPLATLVFRVLQHSGSTQIKFVFDANQVAPLDLAALDAAHTVFSATQPRYWTLVAEKAADHLGSSKSWQDGTLDVVIIPRLDLTSERTRLQDYLTDGDAKASATPEDSGIRLHIVPSNPSVQVGDEFDMRIDLENPNHAEFDTLQLFLAYNPRTLLPLDHDDDNWIRSGVNVFDGAFRKVFPFDLQLENSIDMETGLIDYQMKNIGQSLRTEGTFAAIRFRALAPIPSTRIKVLYHKRGDSPTTGIFQGAKDMLGWSDDLTDGVDFVSIEIREKQAPTEVALPASQ